MLQHRLQESEVRVSLSLWLRRWQQHCSLSTEIMGLEANVPLNYHMYVESGNSLSHLIFQKKKNMSNTSAQYISQWTKTNQPIFLSVKEKLYSCLRQLRMYSEEKEI